MSADVPGQGPLPAAFLTPGSSSFLDFLKEHSPGVLPPLPETPTGRAAAEVRHGTTIVAATYADGVLLAGDRRFTAGNLIAHREGEKVFPADEFSAVGISGTVGLSVDMVRLFQLELEHYEKVEGVPLSLVGKVNRLTSMIRDNLGMAMQGFAAVPLFAGYDLAARRGRIFSFDITGGHSEEFGFAFTGSGSPFARGSLKKLHREGMSEDEIVTAVVQALYDAADEDTATGGPDLTRELFPSVALITEDGYRRLPQDRVAELARAVLDQRRQRPDGPIAPPL
ncbi:proteasome subunit beta [Streptomyces millisiae]|uniref:Proteasome subunit beta n=1 Tax=Streptomyces millisiae TaxID=3075542 RepID=A0ABU2LRP4_9ACTN|nr:proteasome subunit beta [Streptomyces sp. DSM 44918]MDT0320265.1 proteasome subunit beta [Streptomyces sp. DSM 44918]